jgi:hypothetical protein
MNPLLWVFGFLLAPFWVAVLLFLKVLWWMTKSVLTVVFDMSIEFLKLLVYAATELNKAIQERRNK